MISSERELVQGQQQDRLSNEIPVPESENHRVTKLSQEEPLAAFLTFHLV